ncbi:MAG: hypothetical protein MJ252_11610 [archaeon]|nr:hypothetical protein [archaeon]
MNIYNKFTKYPNGTLINNWYEEDELKKQTGTARSLPGYPFKMRNADPELRKSIPRDDTFKRVIGQKEPSKDYFTTSSAYGNFLSPNSRYNQEYLEESKNQMTRSFAKKLPPPMPAAEIEKYDPKVDLVSTYGSVYTPKPVQENIGRKIMFDQFHDPIDKDKPDKLFMARHGVGKYPSILDQDQIIKYVNNGGKGKLNNGNQEITFWSSHLGNSNMYHSFTFAPNPFGRSHAFSQPVQRTKGPNCQNQFFPNTETLPPLSELLPKLSQTLPPIKERKEEPKVAEPEGEKIAEPEA